MNDQPAADDAVEPTTSDAAKAPVIDPEQTRLLSEQAFERPLTACHWDPLDRFLFVGSEDNGIQRFAPATGEITQFVGPHDSWVRAIDTTPDGAETLSGGYDGRLVWWPTGAEKPEPIRVVDAHQGWIRALTVSPDGNRIATCGNDHFVRLWDRHSGELLNTFAGHQWHVYNVAFTPSGDALVSCDLRGFVNVWNPGGDAAKETSEAADGEGADVAAGSVVGPLRELPQVETLYKYDNTFRADIGGARCIAFSADGGRVALGGVTNVTNAFAGVGDTSVVLVDITTGEPSALFAPKDKIRGTAWGVTQHRDQFWVVLAGGGGGGWFYFWRDDEPNEFFKFKLKNDGRGMSVSPDATRIAVAHADRQLRIYALYADPTET